MTQNLFAERMFHAQDDVPIYYRDYGGQDATATPVVCLTGLTRNSRDFAKLAARLQPARRVLCMDYRGRGRSGRDPEWRNYQPRTYVGDVMHLLASANLHRAVFVGTSLGGLVTMGLAAAMPTALAGVVLNDVGPELDPKGIERIKGYVGKAKILPSLEAAAALLAEQFAPIFPDFSQADWLDYAEGTFVKDPAGGGYHYDYDLRLIDALHVQAEESLRDPPDLWALFGGLADIPGLLFRGRNSDILAPATVQRMAAIKPDLTVVEVPNRGHVPRLDEPVCVNELDRFLAAVDARETSARL